MDTARGFRTPWRAKEGGKILCEVLFVAGATHFLRVLFTALAAIIGVATLLSGPIANFRCELA